MACHRGMTCSATQCGLRCDRGGAWCVTGVWHRDDTVMWHGVSQGIECCATGVWRMLCHRGVAGVLPQGDMGCGRDAATGVWHAVSRGCGMVCHRSVACCVAGVWHGVPQGVTWV